MRYVCELQNSYHYFALCVLIIAFVCSLWPGSYLLQEWHKKSETYYKAIGDFDYWNETGVYITPEMGIVMGRLVWVLLFKKEKSLREYLVIVSYLIGAVSTIVFIRLVYC